MLSMERGSAILSPMSFDEDRRRREGLTHDKKLTSPNQAMEQQLRELETKRKELTELKSKVERSQVMQKTEGQQNAGAIKKAEVITAGSKSGGRDAQNMQLRQERLKQQVEKQQGTTEQGRKNP